MRTHVLARTEVAALLAAMPAHAQTMTGGVGKRLGPRRPAVLLALLASASSRTLLAALTVGSFNAGLLASASAETCVTGVNPTFANVISGVTGQPGATVVTAVTPTFSNAVTGVQTTQTPVLTSATLNQFTGTAITSLTSGTVTGITPGTNNPNLRTIAVDASIANNAPPNALFAFNPNGTTTSQNSGTVEFTNITNPGTVGPLLTVPFLNGTTTNTTVVTGVATQNSFLNSQTFVGTTSANAITSVTPASTAFVNGVNVTTAPILTDVAATTTPVVNSVTGSNSGASAPASSSLGCGTNANASGNLATALGAIRRPFLEARLSAKGGLQGRWWSTHSGAKSRDYFHTHGTT